ncbi:hypothetical protein ACQUJZ_20585 [Ralstonia pseudosolanacearum]|uniref:hypothetical protein n=1 Tax=Ralstonia pseudosolanacearum TaxID=1310165 RepID=UPI0013E3FF03|nr:hypothetical protein [Ralstonia pseudosolanacearum]MCK4138554.1 hypothetical protein [Ralstonia pseudosolanacearum]UQY85598.1 hypothetical protein JNO62_20755 [Ralstonia pseudosolanacearum]
MRSPLRTGAEPKPGSGQPFAMVTMPVKGDLDQLDKPGPIRFEFDVSACTLAIAR